MRGVMALLSGLCLHGECVARTCFACGFERDEVAWSEPAARAASLSAAFVACE